MSAPSRPTAAIPPDGTGEPTGHAIPFTAQLRARPGLLHVGDDAAGPRWTVRVQMPEVWDVVKLSAAPSQDVHAVKRRALEALHPDATDGPDAFVVKLGGIEVLDESASLADVGATDGSILLVTYRRRRPVR